MRYTVKVSAAWTETATALEQTVTRARKEDWTYEGEHDEARGAIEEAILNGPGGSLRPTEMTIRVEGRA